MRTWEAFEQMNQVPFGEAMHALLRSIETSIDAIEQGGDSAHLQDLRATLLNLFGVIHRDPGIEAAGEDLYSAATAVLSDSTDRSQPAARKLRLLREARARFRDRLAMARPPVSQ